MKRITYAVLAFAPALVLAQGAGAETLSGISALVESVESIVNKVIPVMFALAIIYFFWGLIKFIQGAGDPKKREEGRGIMIYGIIAIFIMVAIYGLINWIASTFGVTITGTTTLPTIPTR